MKKENKILLIIIANVIIIVAQISFGLISNSFALIADALHNAGDVLSIVITYIALVLATKSTTFKQTFGYLRAEMMAAFVNTLFLYITMLYMIFEGFSRFFNPEVINPIYMIVVGFIAFLANAISAYFLNNLEVNSCSHSHHNHSLSTHHHQHEDANIKSAYLHMLSDALISLAVVIAGIFIYFFKIYSIDSILTVLFSIYILFHSYPLLKRSFLSLMDMNIVEVKEEDLKEIINEDKNILEYHDLHIHKPSSKHNFISFHIVLKDLNTRLEEIENITSNLELKLKKLGFNHILIQVDSKRYIKNHTNCIL